MDNKALLEWYLDMGVDEAVGEEPVNRFAPPLEDIPAPTPEAKPTAVLTSPSAAAAESRALADSCTTLAELEAALRNFNGCSLKKTAGKTVFADGTPSAPLLIIGEAPGDEEDQQGIPFCGASGQLLDKMLAAIGIDRTGCFITNTVYWRPPGNRQPTPEEINICRPFVEKTVALVQPELLLLCGGVAVTAMLGKSESLSRLRAKTYDYTTPYMAQSVPALVTYHPAYLLRQPAGKRLSWQDLLIVKDKLKM